MIPEAQLEDQNNYFNVVIRLRPPLPREKPLNGIFHSIVEISKDRQHCSITEYLGTQTNDEEREKDIKMHPEKSIVHKYIFDCAYDMVDSQKMVYTNTAQKAINSLLEGYNATMFAYGQTGTGKTYTMEGFHYARNHEDRGMIPRAVEDIFSHIENCPNKSTKFMVRASYLQIYMEIVSDLLALPTHSKALQIREDKKKGLFVEGLSEWTVRRPDDICELLKRGALYRKTAHTKMNDLSSRSHAVFILIVEQLSDDDHLSPSKCRKRTIKTSKLNIVDLAGSERVSVSGATGNRLLESRKINQSLSALGNVISALTDLKNRSHIPYRDSKLTRMLEDSLGGNCKTIMMAMISPSNDSFSETLSTLKFAHRAKKVRNTPKINEDIDQKTLLVKYENELKAMKNELEEKNKILINSNNCAPTIPEAVLLKERIKNMASQFLCGGQKIEETPEFRQALEQKQREFVKKINEIEKERKELENNKAEFNQYKDLLLKQRDIMIGLTEKLNERDQANIQLNNEIEAYDNLTQNYETKISNLECKVYQLEKFIQENGLVLPISLQNKSGIISPDKIQSPKALSEISFCQNTPRLSCININPVTNVFFIIFY